MNKTILPLSAGLLISMAIRYDHAFAFSNDLILPGLTPQPLHEAQIITLRNMALVYDNFKRYGQTQLVDSITAMQLLEEATGEGFYKPEREGEYRSCATIEALREADQLTNDKVTYSGVIPILTVEGEE